MNLKAVAYTWTLNQMERQEPCIFLRSTHLCFDWEASMETQEDVGLQQLCQDLRAQHWRLAQFLILVNKGHGSSYSSSSKTPPGIKWPQSGSRHTDLWKPWTRVDKPESQNSLSSSYYNIHFPIFTEGSWDPQFFSNMQNFFILVCLKPFCSWDSLGT